MKCCAKHSKIKHVHGALDGRPLYRCAVCGSEWTEGNPYLDDDQSLIWIATFDRWKMWMGLMGAPQ